MGPAMVVATADRKFMAYFMEPEPKLWQPFESQLKQQTRIVLSYTPIRKSLKIIGNSKKS